MTTDDKNLADTVRALANYGSDRRYHNIYIGNNCRMDPIQAAVLNVKLPSLDDESRRRRDIARTYTDTINNPAVILPDTPDDLSCVWHQYVLRVPGGRRDALRRFLADHGVQTDVLYPVPPHRQPAMEAYAHLDLPVADAIADEVLSLPVSACTSVEDAREIGHIINEFKG